MICCKYWLKRQETVTSDHEPSWAKLWLFNLNTVMTSNKTLCPRIVAVWEKQGYFWSKNILMCKVGRYLWIFWSRFTFFDEHEYVVATKLLSKNSSPLGKQGYFWSKNILICNVNVCYLNIIFFVKLSVFQMIFNYSSPIHSATAILYWTQLLDKDCQSTGTTCNCRIIF